MKIDLTKGIVETDQYKAFKFPGGEIHFTFKDKSYFEAKIFEINTRLNSSDDLIFLILVIDTINKDIFRSEIKVFIPYMPYQQADRNFSYGECFSLKAIVSILNSLPVDEYKIYDPHSDVTPALLKNCKIIDNSEYIKNVISLLSGNLILLSPDAGAYKKIYKLAEKINFKGEIASANKSRSISTGNIDSLELSKQDFEGKDVLIVDDICIGGRTFIELSKKLKERNIGNLYLAISHGIFSNGFSELSLHFTKIFTTNSRKNEYELGFEYSRPDFTPKPIESNFLSIHNIF